MKKSIQQIIGESLAIIKGEPLNSHPEEAAEQPITLDVSQVPEEETLLKAQRENDIIKVIDILK